MIKIENQPNNRTPFTKTQCGVTIGWSQSFIGTFGFVFFFHCSTTSNFDGQNTCISESIMKWNEWNKKSLKRRNKSFLVRKKHIHHKNADHIKITDRFLWKECDFILLAITLELLAIYSNRFSFSGIRGTFHTKID